jgi:hyperosmotically inducible periplasmic protein
MRVRCINFSPALNDEGDAMNQIKFTATPVGAARAISITNTGKLIIAIFCAATLAACDKSTPPNPPKTDQTVGQKLDSVIDKSNEKIGEISNKVGAQMEKASEAVSNASSSVATDVGSAASKTSDALSDGAITASINADLLKDPELSIVKIDVDTKAGAVTLNGLAPNEGARKRAEKIARAIKGVTAVNNYLSVKK